MSCGLPVMMKEGKKHAAMDLPTLYQQQNFNSVADLRDKGLCLEVCCHRNILGFNRQFLDFSEGDKKNLFSTPIQLRTRTFTVSILKVFIS